MAVLDWPFFTSEKKQSYIPCSAYKFIVELANKRCGYSSWCFAIFHSSYISLWYLVKMFNSLRYQLQLAWVLGGEELCTPFEFLRWQKSFTNFNWCLNNIRVLPFQWRQSYLNVQKDPIVQFSRGLCLFHSGVFQVLFSKVFEPKAF